MADRYGDRDSERYGGRGYGRYGGRDEDEDDRLGRYRQGLDYRGPYDVISRRTRGGQASGRDYGDEAYGGRDDRSGYERDYGSDYGRDYGRGYARGYGRGEDEADEARYRRERYYGGAGGARGYDYGGYGRDYEGGYGRGEERVYGRGYGRGYDYDEGERDYRREDEERSRGRGAQTDYGRTSSRFFGRGGGEYEGRGRSEYEGRAARGYDDDDDERGRRGYEYEEGERGGGGGRGWLDRVSDEVASWFGDREAVRRRRLDEKRARRRGRGPKGYKRSDERIREDVNDRLSDQDYLDASEVVVAVSGGEVTLSGTVQTRYDKRLAEDIAESVSGVTQVQNNLRVEYRHDAEAQGTDETTVVAARPAAVTGMLGGATPGATPGLTNDERSAGTTPGVAGGATSDVTVDTNDAGGASSSGASSGGR